eukprot:GFYU01026489.1.p1 GENE.GFYU01026489.1~~GFYU01026489.1.p1  ORF type:complete len:552 (+),score=90.21 GFYU01026489.1:79-1734(+)
MLCTYYRRRAFHLLHSIARDAFPQPRAQRCVHRRCPAESTVRGVSAPTPRPWTASIMTSTSPRSPRVVDPVVAIIGPTGVGKTKLSIEVAKALGGEIVNTDSMQVYRDFSIGTAKVTDDEADGVIHHLLDLLDPVADAFTVSEYRDQALATISEIHSRGVMPILVGGTNYYTEAVLTTTLVNESKGGDDGGGVDEAGDSDESSEDNDGADPSSGLEVMETSALYEELKEVDPLMARRLHHNDRRKIKRSLQIFRRSGKTHSSIIEAQSQKLRYNCHIIWLDASTAVLHERIDKRINNMLRDGLLDEVFGLFAMYEGQRSVTTSTSECDDATAEDLTFTKGLAQSIGYKEFVRFYQAKKDEVQSLMASEGQCPLNPPEGQGSLNAPDSDAGSMLSKLKQLALYSRYEDDPLLSECTTLLQTNTKQYVRRQRQWIRNRFEKVGMPITRIDTSDISNWDTAIRDHAIQMALNIHENRSSDVRTGVLPSQWQQHTCEACNRTIDGEQQWAAHLNGRSHKRAVKKRQQQENNPYYKRVKLQQQEATADAKEPPKLS